MKDNIKFIIGLIVVVAVICVISLLASNENKPSQQSSVVPQSKSGYEIEKEMREKITPEYLDSIVRTLSALHFEYIDSVEYSNPLEEEISKLNIHSIYKDSCYSAFIHLWAYIYGKPKIPSGKKDKYHFSLFGSITDANIENPIEDLNRELEIYDKNHVYIYCKGKDLDESNEEQREWERAHKRAKSKSIATQKSNESNSDYSDKNTSSAFTSNIVKTGRTVSINTTCIGAIDESTLDKISKSASRGDEGVMKVAVASGYAIVVQQGTSATIVSIRTGKVRVKLSDGRMVWVLYKHVK